MRFSVVANTRAQHQVGHQQALAEGLRKFGVDPVITSSAHPSIKYVACWGWRLGAALRQQGHEVLVMERGYLGDRFMWTSLGWNGLNGYAEFPAHPESGRFNQHHKMRPWRETDGKYVVVMGQVPGDASLRGRNMVPWYESVAVMAADAYGLPVLFRNHPVAAQKGHNIRPRHTAPAAGTMEDVLKDAHVVITYNSNSAVDSVLAGVPTVTMDRGSMAWDVTGHNIGELVKPDRAAWAEQLAWKQWTIDEITSGEALNGLLEMKL